MRRALGGSQRETEQGGGKTEGGCRAKCGEHLYGFLSPLQLCPPAVLLRDGRVRWSYWDDCCFFLPILLAFWVLEADVPGEG